jgi:hypothetical protein
MGRMNLNPVKTGLFGASGCIAKCVNQFFDIVFRQFMAGGFGKPFERGNHMGDMTGRFYGSMSGMGQLGHNFSTGTMNLLHIDFNPSTSSSL